MARQKDDPERAYELPWSAPADAACAEFPGDPAAL